MGRVSSTEELGGGVSVTFKVTLEDGTSGNFKLDERNRIGRPEHEVAAWEVAKQVGMEDMVPAAVIRVIDNPSPPPTFGDFIVGMARRKGRPVWGGVDGDPSKMRGSFTEWMDGSPADRIVATVGAGIFGDSEHDVMRAAMFDFIIGNADRHGGNWVVDDGKIRLIDHNRAFASGNLGGWRVSSFTRRLTLEPTGVGPAAYAKPYLDKKPHILAALVRVGVDNARVAEVSKRIDWAVSAGRWDSLEKMYPKAPA